jgi:hypothetical protein
MEAVFWGSNSLPKQDGILINLVFTAERSQRKLSIMHVLEKYTYYTRKRSMTQNKTVI